jgi:hypothetical protein
MSQSNGLGSVTVKNKLLVPPPATEKITAVRHCNGKDYWIIAHPANTNAFQAFLLNSSGLDTIPIVSNVGVSHTFKHCLSGYYWLEGMGVLKASPNGKKLVSAIQSDSIPVMEIFDFNNSTGQVSNPLQCSFPGMFGPYGATFSPDNSKVYCENSVHTSTYDTTFLYQFDLSSGVPAQILASKTLLQKVGTANTDFFGEMQLAPDGKIYLVGEGTNALAAITNPNQPGLACGYMNPVIALPFTSINEYGLPNFIDANQAGIHIKVPDVQLCGTFTASIADAGAGYANYQWNTGATTQTISITSPGQYWVTVSDGLGCQVTDTLGAYLLSSGKEDTLACDTFHADVVHGGVLQYHWNDGSAMPVRDFTQSGSYYVDIGYVNGCGIRDSIDLTVVASPQIELGPPLGFCKDDIVVSGYCNTCNYQWNTGQTSAAIAIKGPGTYWVNVTDVNGCRDHDTLTVYQELGTPAFVMPNIVTPNGDNINDEVDFGKYQFAILNIEIYNRWGQKMFSSDDPGAVWRPTGDEGTYFYAGQYKIACGTDAKLKELKGYITLAR